MQELIKVTLNHKKQQVVSARELHQFLENTDNVNTWFKRQSERAMLLDGEDFIAILQQSTGGRPNQDYAILLSAAKEIAMLNGGEKGKQARLYFIECEKKMKEMLPVQFEIPKTYAAALLEAGRLALELDAVTAKLIEAQPKVEFYDQVTDSTDSIDLGTAAKVLNLGFGRTTMFDKLRKANVLMSNNNPYQTYIDNGWFRVIETKWNKPNGDTHIYFKTMVFQKGLDGIRKLLAKNK